jgi:hypothetical protein
MVDHIRITDAEIAPEVNRRRAVEIVRLHKRLRGGQYPCPGCGKPISINKPKCLACTEGQAVEVTR